MAALPRVGGLPGASASRFASRSATRSDGSPPSRSGRRGHRPRLTLPRWTASRCARADTVGAGESTPLLLPESAFAVVDTGDPLPEQFDAVVMREDVHYVAGQAELRAAVAPYQHVRSIGEDISATELLLPAGHRMRPVDVAAAAASGATEVVVRRQPVVAILPTGDEMRPIGSALAPGELLDTNSLMLAAQARELGCEILVLAIEPDDQTRIAEAIREAVATVRPADRHRGLQRRARRLHRPARR